MTDLGPKLSQLAEGILDELLEPASDVALDQKIDALKAIGTLHLGLARLAGKKKDDDGEEEGFSMLEFRRRMRATDTHANGQAEGEE